MFSLFKKKPRRLRTKRFYSAQPAAKPANHTLYSIGFVKVFKTQHGVLRVSNLPKRTAKLAIRKGADSTISTCLGVTELFITDINMAAVPLVGDRPNDNW